MGTVATATHGWCRVCGTEHTEPRICPGDLRATGAEKPGWRVEIETPHGHEAIGVLLAPSHDVWRARIVTFPNVLWTAPGGGGAMKFVGGTREEAEALAVAFIEQHVRSKRSARRGGPTPTGPSTPSASPRKLRCLPVRFGRERAGILGLTVNLSAEGMFINVSDPEEEGFPLRINLEIEAHTLPLRGLVMWNRLRPDYGRPVGMGIRLAEPPPMYRSFVASL
ncbi:MAG TPA: hypothetical protein VFB67_09620 [Candidatus Polarisedimenticolaceae bacterium]|nr:hypothetical protein [Candidatus Polarisedimenticolaceae bacterium]